ncbi:glutathione S-transferase C-terminal-like protein [Cristinia sonorae]|uniref:Glutathione S-transferase C-terminal-like protein n=1 Tax=Cristinia sonorae TaxID=1940300 RepID=A0A8K0UEF3_9AGAR|nr:glutathione S-transferase C-terminal-like protein [Cristinia sonorae]
MSLGLPFRRAVSSVRPMVSVAATKHFTLYSCNTGPNGWKVAFLLNELGLEYETRYLNVWAGEQKSPEYLKVNPNGRVPALIDHKNNDYTLWESGAILLYLTDKYDAEGKYGVKEEDRHKLYQWLFFQASGQGPYFGQGYWFNHVHHEKLPSAQKRYQDEVRRVLGVLEGVLTRDEWLVGEKISVADLAFVPWNNLLTALLGKDFCFERAFPATWRWHQRVLDRPGVREGLRTQTGLVGSVRST